MKLNEYQQLASRTLPGQSENHFFGFDYPNVPNGFKRPTVEIVSLSDLEAHTKQHGKNTDLIHAALGLTTEVGELADPIKKAMFYGKPLDEANIKEEAGDLLWYLAGPLCRALGCTLEELAAANIAKLRARYPDTYSDQHAIARADK